MPLRRRELWIVAALAAAFALLALPRGRPLALPQLGAPDLAGAPVAPPFDLPRAAGGRLALSELAGRVVLLNFWATWCAPCRDELPALQALHETLAREGLAVVAVSVDAGAPDAVARFAAARGLGFAVLHDPSEEVARRYGALAYPTSVVIDRSGRIVQRAVGAFAWQVPESVAWFRARLAERQ
jgi:peroxiredoxin